ncbi:MAG: hypothetical protein IJZ53_10755 [Tyzzerella sp.]|nr:hypothetical protein [Tyzzerella sp.]
MKLLNIGGKEYKLEFTIEASLYNECTEKTTMLMQQLAEAQKGGDAKELIKSIADIPQTTLTMFYAGLLEHHGEEGDGTVISKKEAKVLVKQYFEEHKEDGTGNFYDLLGMLMEQMGKDGFFGQIGLTQGAKQAEKTGKVPQDHKKKTTAKATGK